MARYGPTTPHRSRSVTGNPSATLIEWVGHTTRKARAAPGTLTGTYQWLESQWGEGQPGGAATSIEMADSLHRETFVMDGDGGYSIRAYTDQGQTLYTDSGTWNARNGKLTLTTGEFSIIWDYTLEVGRLTMTRVMSDGDFSYWQRVIYEK